MDHLSDAVGEMWTTVGNSDDGTGEEQRRDVGLDEQTVRHNAVLDLHRRMVPRVRVEWVNTLDRADFRANAPGKYVPAYLLFSYKMTGLDGRQKHTTWARLHLIDANVEVYARLLSGHDSKVHFDPMLRFRVNEYPHGTEPTLRVGEELTLSPAPMGGVEAGNVRSAAEREAALLQLSRIEHAAVRVDWVTNLERAKFLTPTGRYRQVYMQFSHVTKAPTTLHQKGGGVWARIHLLDADVSVYGKLITTREMKTAHDERFRFLIDEYQRNTEPTLRPGELLHLTHAPKN